jgi:hypothetical protein
MKAHTMGLATLISGALILGTAAMSTAAPQGTAAAAAATAQAKIALAPSSQQLARCFPKARARVKVDLTTNTKGFDTFTITATGLKPKTDFTVFLLEQSGPFGAAEYIGDFTADKRGNAVNAFKLIVAEAFAFNNATGSRTDLNAIGVWFAALSVKSNETGMSDLL